MSRVGRVLTSPTRESRTTEARAQSRELTQCSKSPELEMASLVCPTEFMCKAKLVMHNKLCEVVSIHCACTAPDLALK